MKEVYPNLFVGAAKDLPAFENIMYKRIMEGPSEVVGPPFFLVQAAKEPFHRQTLGYKTRGAPKSSPEYLYAVRNNRMVLNLVDVEESKAEYIPDALLHSSADFIDRAIREHNKPVFVHCNQGVSRGPSAALFYLIKHTQAFCQCDLFSEVENLYKHWCPDYNPNGIRVKVKEFWNLCQKPKVL